MGLLQRPHRDSARAIDRAALRGGIGLTSAAREILSAAQIEVRLDTPLAVLLAMKGHKGLSHDIASKFKKQDICARLRN